MKAASRILEGPDGIRLEVAGRVFTIGGSIGVAYAGKGVSGSFPGAAAVLAAADRACILGKRFGGRSIQVHPIQADDFDSIHAEVAERYDPDISGRSGSGPLCNADHVPERETNRMVRNFSCVFREASL